MPQKKEGTGESDAQLVDARLKPESMLDILQSGFVPKRNETFIDALFRDWEKLGYAEKLRFRDYIKCCGTIAEKRAMKKLGRCL